MLEEVKPPFRRIRKQAVLATETAQVEGAREEPENFYKGFGSVPGETLEQFHERMYDLTPLEAMIYLLEVELDQ